MNTTPVSLLERLQQPADQAAWERFVKLYTPLLLYWARRLGLQEPDAADLVQDVFTTLVQKLPAFRYDSQKTFRGWLRVVLMNTWRNHCARRVVVQASDTALAQLAVPDAVADLDEAEYRQHLVARALELMQADFQPATWKACWELVVNSRPAAEVATELGITVNAVYLAKSRVLSRLRQELKELLDGI